MLQNPLVIALFAITPEFAALHRSLSSVARFKIELRKGSTGSGAAAGSMIFGSASMRLGTERAGSMMAGDGGSFDGGNLSTGYSGRNRSARFLGLHEFLGASNAQSLFKNAASEHCTLSGIDDAKQYLRMPHGKQSL